MGTSDPVTRRKPIMPCRTRSGPAVFAVALLGLCLGGRAEATGYANPQLLIETGEVARLVDARGVRLVDLRRDPDRGEASYRAGHLPAAVFLPWRELDDAQANTEGWPIRPEAATALFGRLGIDHDTQVVAYDDAGSVLAARLFFVLEYFGHQQVRVLNGGLAKWQREGRPLSAGVPKVRATRFVPRARRELLATADEVQASLGKEEVCLIDARSAAEYAGKDVRAQRGGHIPGAALVDWADTLNPDQTFKPAAVLRAIFEAAGVRPDRQVVVYCQTGFRSSHDYFVLRLLGHTRVRNYDGSWNEWGNDARRPIGR
jgi:thiosulfate/3-mercaptopyruvate sulfurtransferase